MPAVWAATSPGPPPQFLCEKGLSFHQQHLLSTLDHDACFVSCLSYGFLRVLLKPLLLLEVCSACSSLELLELGLGGVGERLLLLNIICKTRRLSWVG